MIDKNTLILQKIILRDGEAFNQLIINECAQPITGFIPVKQIKENGEVSSNTVYIAVSEIQGIEIADEMQPLTYDFIPAQKVKVKEA